MRFRGLKVVEARSVDDSDPASTSFSQLYKTISISNIKSNVTLTNQFSVRLYSNIYNEVNLFVFNTKSGIDVSR